MAKRLTTMMALVMLMLALTAGVALAVTKVGGPGNDLLRGTDRNDEL